MGSLKYYSGKYQITLGTSFKSEKYYQIPLLWIAFGRNGFMIIVLGLRLSIAKIK
jgi:hypothetical protein